MSKQNHAHGAEFLPEMLKTATLTNGAWYSHCTRSFGPFRGGSAREIPWSHSFFWLWWMVLGCPLRKAGDDANHLVQSALQPSAPPSPLPRPIESILKALCVQYLCAVRGKKILILMKIQFLLPRKKPGRPIQITVCLHRWILLQFRALPGRIIPKFDGKLNLLTTNTQRNRC